MPATHVVTDDELTAATEAATKAGVVNTAEAVAEVIQRMQTAEVVLDGLAAHFALAKVAHKDWFAAADKAIDTGDHAELIAAAFEGKGSVDARGKLLKALGPVECDKLAQAHSLKSVGDFSRPGKTPTDAKPLKSAQNPFADESPAGEARRISFIRSRGTKASSSLAAAVHRDIAGRPLRAA
jgi:hypothetical protein